MQKLVMFALIICVAFIPSVALSGSAPVTLHAVSQSANSVPLAAITKYYSYQTGSWVEGQGTEANYDLLVLLPDGHDPSVAYPWVLQCHGAGNTSRSYDEHDPAADYPAYTLANAYLAAGYVVVVPYQTTSYGWGNPASLAAIKNSRDYAVANYNLMDTAIIGGNSMGGLAGLLTLVAHPTWFHAAAFMYPVSSLDANHAPEPGNRNYKKVINRAYGCRNRNYKRVTAGHHPEEMIADFAALGITFGIWHGADDVVVNPNQSATFRDAVNEVGPSVVVYSSVAGAGHGSARVADQFAADLPRFLATLDVALSR